jgi:hypothetical protein
MIEGQSSSGSHTDFSQPEQPGQQQIGKGCQSMSTRKLALIDTPVGCVLLCIGEPFVSLCPAARVDAAGKPACELCGRRLSTVKHTHRHGVGHACHPRCKPVRTKERAAAVSAPAAATPRTKRPYDTLGPTQQWKRRKQALADITNTLQNTGCPLESLQLQSRPSPAELIHLSTAERERIRTVPSLHIPCEQTMIACKKQLAHTHATETDTFAGGAYVTDPIRFLSVLCAQSSLLAVAVIVEAVTPS